ncbi:unnamed protein product, partial [Natator depressus]
MAFPGTAANNVTLLIPPHSPDDTQKKFPRKNEALGAIQIIVALIHLGLGGILFFSSKESLPLCMASWYRSGEQRFSSFLGPSQLQLQLQRISQRVWISHRIMRQSKCFPCCHPHNHSSAMEPVLHGS